MDKRAMKRKVCELDTEYVARIATTMQGLACSRCDEALSIEDTRWRWNGENWEHKCGDAQAGHFVAVKKESEGEK